jgi:hypothetical protein
MAFPTPTPSDRAVHVENGDAFAVQGGKWIRRPGVRVSFAERSDVKGVSVSPDRDDGSISLVINLAFRMKGDGDIQFNVAKQGGWLSPNDPTLQHYQHLSANLHNGGGSWRQPNWNALAAPNSAGIFLNWADGNWKFGNTYYGNCQVTITKLTTDWSVINWLIFGRHFNQEPMRVMGQGIIHADPSNIREVVFNTNSRFDLASIVTEVY